MTPLSVIRFITYSVRIMKYVLERMWRETPVFMSYLVVWDWGECWGLFGQETEIWVFWRKPIGGLIFWYVAGYMSIAVERFVVYTYMFWKIKVFWDVMLSCEINNFPIVLNYCSSLIFMVKQSKPRLLDHEDD